MRNLQLQVDADGNGEVDFTEFLTMALSMKSGRNRSSGFMAVVNRRVAQVAEAREQKLAQEEVSASECRYTQRHAY